MKSLLILVAGLWIAAGTAQAASSVDLDEIRFTVKPGECRSFSTPSDKTELNKRGCCSHHGGVCDCVNGRVKCCDGTLSPTCTC